MSISFPPAFEERMKSQLGNEFDSFRDAHHQDSPVSIRINPAKQALPESDLVPWARAGTYLPQRPVFTLDPALHAGAYYVQEASSMFLEQVVRQSVDLSQPLSVLDLCAAPGGKSTHLLSLLHPGSLLVSNDVIRARATVLSENLQKWGSPNVVVTNNDPHDFQVMAGYFDLIVVDAPCSGEGLFRKDPAAMDEWSEENASRCSQRQRRILTDVWPALKPGGVLIYCTCTYNPAENGESLASLESVSEKIDIVFPQGTTPVHLRQFFPHTSSGEGFFISAVRKINEENPARIKAKPVFNFASTKLTARLADWIRDAGDRDFILQDDLLMMIPNQYQSDIAFMMHKLRVITKGTAVATVKHEKLIPEHALALSTELRPDNFMTLDLDRHQALRYLRKDNLEPADTRKGFALVRYQGLGLGWANLLSNRINNLYPGAWRIRMEL